jgi:hypothetical protein
MGDVNATVLEATQRLESALIAGKDNTTELGPLAAMPEFLMKLGLRGLSSDPGQRPSMADFLDEFEDRKFAILAGADAAEVSTFAAWAEELNPDD